MAIAAIGGNSRASELAPLAAALRIELEAHEMTAAWRARWEMVLDLTMQPSEKLIGLLISFFEEFRGEGNPGIKMLEMITGLSDRRIRAAIKLQEERGFLVKRGGGHRGHASSYSVQIPEKTLRELAERRQPIAAFSQTDEPQKGGNDGSTVPPLSEKGGIAGSGVPPLPPLPPLKGGSGVPPLSPYIESNNNYPSKGEEEEEGARERADAKPLVYANGTAFEGPGFRLEYELIRLNGAMIGFSDEKSKLIGELVAWQWATSGFVPQSVPYAFQKALANRKIRLETTESKIKIEIERIKAESSAAPADRAPPSARASPSGRRDWRDEQAENDMAGIRALEEVRAKRLAKSCQG